MIDLLRPVGPQVRRERKRAGHARKLDRERRLLALIREHKSLQIKGDEGMTEIARIARVGGFWAESISLRHIAIQLQLIWIRRAYLDSRDADCRHRGAAYAL